MKKLILSLAMLAVLSSCNQKDEITPDVPTTDVGVSFNMGNLIITNSQAATSSNKVQRAGANSREIPGCVDEIKVTAERVMSHKLVEKTFRRDMRGMGMHNFPKKMIMGNVMIGSNRFTASLGYGENTFKNLLKFANLDNELDSFKELKPESKYGDVRVQKNIVYGESNEVEFDEFKVVNSAAKIILRNTFSDYKMDFDITEKAKSGKEITILDNTGKAWSKDQCMTILLNNIDITEATVYTLNVYLLNSDNQIVFSGAMQINFKTAICYNYYGLTVSLPTEDDASMNFSFSKMGEENIGDRTITVKKD